MGEERVDPQLLRSAIGKQNLSNTWLCRSPGVPPRETCGAVANRSGSSPLKSTRLDVQETHLLFKVGVCGGPAHTPSGDGGWWAPSSCYPSAYYSLWHHLFFCALSAFSLQQVPAGHTLSLPPPCSQAESRAPLSPRGALPTRLVPPCHSGGTPCLPCICGSHRTVSSWALHRQQTETQLFYERVLIACLRACPSVAGFRFGTRF